MVKHRRPIAPPAAARHDVRHETHGRHRLDPYQWLRATNWRDVVAGNGALDEKIRAHLADENRYASELLGEAASSERELFAAMVARTASYMSAPAKRRGSWLYEEAYDPGAEHARHTRRSGDDVQLLLDEPLRARGHAYYASVGAKPSDDGAYYAWAEDTSGDERYTIHIERIGAGASRPPIANTTGRFVLSPCANWVFYVTRNDDGHPDRVWMAALDGTERRLVYAESDAAFFLGVTRTASRSFIAINIFNDACSEVWLVDGTDPTAPPTCVEPRRAGVFYEVEDWAGSLLVRTNLERSDFRLMQGRLGEGAAGWREFLGDGQTTAVEDFRPYGANLAILEKHGMKYRLLVIGQDRIGVSVVSLPAGAAVSLEHDVEPGATTIAFRCWSHVLPQTLMAHDPQTGATETLWQREAPNFDDKLYETLELEAAAPDGVLVPISLLRRLDLPRDGKVLLYGYGAYGHSVGPWFDPCELALVDRGWTYAIAHVRGGGEKGHQWHEQGRGAFKQNSFDDFAAAARKLLEAGIATPGRIVAHGISAGGLLVAATLEQNPDLFGAVISEVPFVDVLNSQLDYSLPLTRPERAEWGDPKHNVEDYDLIARYSPYELVDGKAYPPVLATASVRDARVPYWEAAKWIARLRHAAPARGPFLIETRLDIGGHGGVAGRYAELAKAARLYAFAEWAIDE
ncbi:alpha/beta fold hydrolase [Ensifer sp.]|jgi:oligopeptidase B|uniref:alpha/beta fold hydrolase n=1 Tax=Ensifer sp. TaxID=1872086 RepID=UPI002E12748E|nr:alpha/beta fold hydrolase [Ensifer sp.]